MRPPRLGTARMRRSRRKFLFFGNWDSLSLFGPVLRGGSEEILFFSPAPPAGGAIAVIFLFGRIASRTGAMPLCSERSREDFMHWHG